ncbi:MAG: hypothetical protein JNL38_25560 [Myxococcales bacterium]|jgi:outer membrane protein insertion porin family|nr:hypothetical protein [Myxococcales bacterium]
MRRLAVALALGAVAGCDPAGEPPPRAPVKPPPSASAAAPAGPVCPASFTPPSGAPPSDASYDGETVALVCVLPLAGKPALSAAGVDQARQAITVGQGRPLRTTSVSADLVTLARLGRFGEVAAYAEKAPSGVVVTYALGERPVVSEVVIEGSTGAKPSSPPIPAGAPLDPVAIHTVVEALSSECRSRGHTVCEVKTSTAESAPGSVRVRFDLTEGPQWRFTKVAVTGQKRVSAAEITAAAALPLGKPFDADLLTLAEMRISTRYYDSGMIQAAVSSKADATPDGQVTVTFKVDEGDVFKLRALRFTKLAAAHERALAGVVKVRPGTVFSRSAVKEDLDRVTAFFAARNERVNVVPLTDVHVPSRAVDLTIEVEKP